MQTALDDPIPPVPPSYTEALMNQEDYYEWCSALLPHSSSASHYSSHYQHPPLPSVTSTPYYPISSAHPSFFHPLHQLSHQHAPHHFLFDLPIKPHIQDFNRIQPVLASRDGQVPTKEEPSSSAPSILPLHSSLSPNSSPTIAPSMVSQALTPLPPMVAAVPPAAQHRTTTIPEFIHSPLGSESLQVSADTVIWHLQEPLHRNYYHTIQFRVPSAAYATSPNGVGSNYEAYRIYIHPQLGYSGNAKRFKQAPEPGEKAFILEGIVLDHHFHPIQQCPACLEYFENKSYFVANPHCKGRILLVKNNQVTRIKNGVFSLNMKPMCCSRHHQSPFYFYFILRDTLNSRVVMTSLFMCHVKQWKKTSNSNANKKRKLSSPEDAATLTLNN